MRVVDATGVSYLDTFAENRADVIAGFRRHAAWWIRYVQTPEARAAYARSVKGLPAFPVRVEIEPYDNPTAD